MIASLSGYTNWHEWNKYSSQKSGPINLTAGVRYYVEVLHKEGNENDNLSVGWLTPGQGGSEPSEVIPSSVLSPYIVPSIPEAPDNLTATAISATQVDLIWRDNSNNENGFRIERASGSSSFIEIGTTSANATVFHDAGLSANTQYSYRIRSFNDLGNSEYTSTIPITTLDNGTIVPQAVGLNSFAVYSSDSTILKERSLFDGGGAAGSNKMVEVFPEAIVNGNVISGGYVRLRSQATVNGLARAADSVVLHAGAVVTGVEEGASVAIVDIPQKNTIITGTEKITVSNGSNRILSPGYYNDLTVESSCTLTVSGGLYTFSRFFLQPDAIVLLDIAYSDMVDIEVSGDLEFSDRSKVIFKDKGYVPFIRFYTNDANMVRVGVMVELNGTLTAPHGEIHIFSGSQCEGAVYGKTVYIEPDVNVISDDIVNQTEDNDGDGIPNILEIVMGTNPDDSTDFIPMAIPSNSYIDNTGNVSISYDFSRYFPDYSFATNVKATFPAGSLTRSNIPLLITVRNEPGGSIAPFADSNYNMIGRYFDFLDGNGIIPGMSIVFDGPVPQTLSSEDYVPFQWSDSAGKWVEVTDTISSTSPIIFAAKRSSFSSKTMYFDGGYVYSNKYNSVLRFDIDVPKDTVAITGVDVMVKYLDFTVNSSGDLKIYKTACVYDTVDTAFSYSGHLVCPGKMRIQEFGLIFTDSGAAIDSCIFVCSSGVDVFTAQAVVMHSSFPVKQYLNYPDPANQVSLYFYPCSETFESSNFGDGRITINTTSGDSVVYNYEYYLKDHLGSTRMVINDQGSVIEAMAYHSYGTIVDIGSYSSAIPAREKFTGKEFDQEGSVNGAGGIDAYYFGVRFYDPEVGIWLGTDPMEQFWNTYSYCGGDPINLIDPDGAFVPWGMIAGMAIGGTIGGITAYQNDGNVAGGILAGAAIGGLAGGVLWDMPVAVLMDNGINVYQSIGNGLRSLANGGASFAASTPTYAQSLSGVAQAVGQLTIYSIQSTSSIGSVSFGEHAFLQLSLNQGKVMYQNLPLEYFDTWRSVPGVRSDARGPGPIKNADADYVKDYGPQRITSRTVDISQNQLSKLMERIEAINNGDLAGKDAWSFLRPCSDFAADTWKDVTGEALGHRMLIKSDPRTLFRSINMANTIAP